MDVALGDVLSMTLEVFSSLDDAVTLCLQCQECSHSPAWILKSLLISMWLIINILPLAQDRGSGSSCSDVFFSEAAGFPGVL